jgi:hypothetical protein
MFTFYVYLRLCLRLRLRLRPRPLMALSGLKGYVYVYDVYICVYGPRRSRAGGWPWELGPAGGVERQKKKVEHLNKSG